MRRRPCYLPHMRQITIICRAYVASSICRAPHTARNMPQFSGFCQLSPFSPFLISAASSALSFSAIPTAAPALSAVIYSLYCSSVSFLILFFFDIKNHLRSATRGRDYAPARRACMYTINYVPEGDYYTVSQRFVLNRAHTQNAGNVFQRVGKFVVGLRVYVYYGIGIVAFALV